MIIPERYQTFVKEVAKLAKLANLRDFHITFSPDIFAKDWSDQLEGVWQQGRHGEDAGRISISSTVRVHTEVK